MMQATINDIKVEYSVHGQSGPWLIFSHSLGCTQAVWERQIEELSRDYRILCYDTRGHGKTEATNGPYTLDMLANDALGLIDHLAIEKSSGLAFRWAG